ncbi:MAG: hypothetical protein AAGF11_01550 [Myxococcota bacterium]
MFADRPSTHSRRAWWWAATTIVVAIVLYWPAVDVGFLADDVYQIALLDGLAGPRAPWELYSLYPLDPAATAAHRAQGSLPWWTVPEFRFVQVRPLSSLLLALDHALAPRNPLAHHLHSMAWLSATLVTAHLALRRATTPTIALLALAVYAVDETFGWTVAWLANRCAMISATFAFAALAVYQRRALAASTTTSTTDLRHFGLELTLWVLAFAAGEYALCGVAYVLAHALVGRTDAWRRRLRALLPATLALVGFAALSIAVRAGVHGATSYIDPLGHPVEFMLAGIDRIPRMLGEIWLGLPAESERLLFRYEDSAVLRAIAGLSNASGPPGVVQAHGRFVIVAIVALGLPAWWLARRNLSPTERRAVAWTALGSAGALVPLAAILPSTRALALAALGPAVFVGSLGVASVRALRPRPRQPSAWLRGLSLAALAGTSLLQHLVLDAPWARAQIAGIGSTGRSYLRFHDSPQSRDLPLGDKHVVVIAAPGLVTGLHGRWILHLLGRPLPRSWHALGIGERRLLVRRFDERTLEISTVEQAMHDQPQETLFRPPPEALHTGDEVGVGLFRARVMHEREGQGPASLHFVFDRPLPHAEIVFLVGGPEGLRPFELPPPGRAVMLPPPVLPDHRPYGD